MDEPAPPPQTKPLTAIRLLFAVVIIAAIAVAVIVTLRNEHLRSLIRHPRQHGEQIRSWAVAHPLIAPLAFCGAFLALGSVALPVWWLQILAGFAFGLLRGLFFGLLISAVTSVIAAALSRFVFGELLRLRLRQHTERLTKLDESLNHNGLLVVCGVRLAHFIPAGLSNYAIGLTRISLREVAIGTLIGGLPSTLSLVAIGAEEHILHDWRFITLLVLLNISTIAVLIVRYLRPQWFERFGLH